jgi:hypothetical protein
VGRGRLRKGVDIVGRRISNAYVAGSLPRDGLGR